MMTDPIRASRSLAGFGGPSADKDPTPLTAGTIAEVGSASYTWGETRRLDLHGHVVISQTPTDPGDFGEPRVTTVDDTTYVSVPEFELWPTDPDWSPSDASIVFIEERALVRARPGRVIYHMSRRWTYGSVTRCGRIIWTSNRGDDRVVTLIPMRRDNASRIARPCRICGADDD